MNSVFIMIFAVFSILIVFPIQSNHTISVLSDWSFHASRMEQIFRNLKGGNPFTYIASSTFGNIGTGSFLFYPTVFLYPWAFLHFIFSPITSFAVYICLLFFATFMISFFCMLSFSKGNQIFSLIFSVIYTIAPYHLYLGIGNYVLGEFIAYTFIPLIFLGLFNVLYGDKKKWVLLSIGMTLMLYSHLASVFITCEIISLIFLITLFMNKSIAKSRFINIIKSIVLTALLSSFVLVPFFTDYIGHDVTSVAKGIPILFGADTLFTQSLTNNATNKGGLGIMLVFTTMFGWMWTKNKMIEQISYYLGLFLTIIITSIIPWKVLQNTFLASMQFPYRYTSYAIFFLSVVLASGLSQLLKYFKIRWANVRLLKIIKITGILFMGLFLCIGSSADIILRNNGTTDNNYLIKNKNSKIKSAYTATAPILLDNKNYNYQFNYTVLYGETDYLPQKAIAHVKGMLNHVAFINGRKKVVQPSSSSNKLSYKLNLNKRSTVDLPVVAYNSTQVFVDGSNTSFADSKRGTVKVSIPNGKHIVSVFYEPSKIYFVSLAIAIITWILLICSRKKDMKQTFSTKLKLLYPTRKINF